MVTSVTGRRSQRLNLPCLSVSSHTRTLVWRPIAKASVDLKIKHILTEQEEIVKFLLTILHDLSNLNCDFYSCICQIGR